MELSSYGSRLLPLLEVEDDESSEFNSLALECHNRLNGGKLDIVQLLDVDLKDMMISTHVNQRLKALSFLSKVLANIVEETTQHSFNKDQLGLLASFYTDRLKNDHHSLNPASIAGLCAIMRMAKTSGNVDVLMLGIRALLGTDGSSGMVVQSQVKRERNLIFSTLQMVVQKPEMIKAMGTEFVLGFIQAVDGEKDPTNLMMIFQMWPQIIHHFPLEPLEEDVFEAMACYFPIDFTPPSHSTQTVSRDDLITALRRCLTCHPSFAPFALPLLLEKLDSDLDSAKLDSNLTLIKYLAVLEPHHLAPFLSELWSAYKKELMGIRMTPSTTQVNATSLRSLTSVTELLCHAVQTPENRAQLEKWLSAIWDDTGRHLKDIELKLMSVAVDILAAVASCSGGGYPVYFIVSRTMPIMLQTLAGKQESKGTALKLMAKFLSATDGSRQTNEQTKPWYDEFIHQCNAEIDTEEGCLALASGIHFLQDKNATDILDHMMRQCLEEGRELLPNRSNLMLKLCLKLGRPSNQEVDRLFAALQSTHEPGCNLIRLFEILCCQNIELLTSNILPRLSKMPVDRTSIRMLRTVWRTHSNLDHFMAPKSSIFSEVLTNCEKDSEAAEMFISSIASSLKECHVDEVKRLVFTDGTSLRMEEVVLTHASQDLIRGLERSGHTWKGLEGDPSYSPDCKASILNKTTTPDILSKSLLNRLSSTEQLSDEGQNELVWCLRGLALRSYPHIGPWLELILSHMNDKLADSMAFILSTPSNGGSGKHTAVDNSALDSKTNWTFNEAMFRMTRQKIFSLTKNGLIEQYNQSGKGCMLKAVVSQLPHIPKFLLAGEMSQLLPLLKKCLSCDPVDGPLMVSALTCVKEVLAMEEGKDVTADLIASLYPQWLEIAVASSSAPMSARISALECVRKARGNMAAGEVALHKNVTMQKLTLACDDKKRLVRVAASNAKNAWCLAAA